MTDSPEKRPEQELDELVARLCDGKLDADGFRRIEALTDGEEAMVRRVFLTLNLDAHLRWEFGAGLSPPGESPSRFGNADDSGFGDDSRFENETITTRRRSVLEAVGRGMQRTSEFFTKPTPLSLSLATMLVAAVLLSLTLVYPGGRPADNVVSDPAPASNAKMQVARISRVRGAVWDDGQDCVGGEALYQNVDAALSAGLVEIAFASGASAVVEGPARFRLDSENSVEIAAGKLSAVVPRRATGFKVTTPLAEVVDLGTEFGVSVGAAGTTDVEVFSGRVHVSRQGASPDDVARKLVLAGEAVRIRPTIEAIIDHLAPDGEQFVRYFDPPGLRRSLINGGFERPSTLERGDPKLTYLLRDFNEKVPGWKERTVATNGAYLLNLPALGLPGSLQRAEIPSGHSGDQVGMFIVSGGRRDRVWIYQSLGTASAADVGQEFVASARAAVRDSAGGGYAGEVGVSFRAGTDAENLGWRLGAANVASLESTRRRGMPAAPKPYADCNATFTPGKEHVGVEVFFVVNLRSTKHAPKGDEQYYVDDCRLKVRIGSGNR
jgi:hypothetical protein